MSAVAQARVESAQCVEKTLPLRCATQPVLAMGAWFKNTLCLAFDGQAHVSYCNGDLDTPDACRSHEAMAYALLDWLGEKPACIVHDLHPDFHSSRFAAALSAELNVPLLAVQHHHAHIAAIAAEHAVAEPVLGLALDGVGLGNDGTAWGGELLRVEGDGCRRLGHLYPLPLPGGDRAAREPWRMAAGVMHEIGRAAEIPTRFGSHSGATTVADMLRRRFNCPGTSSMGRLFDAASGLLGICGKMEFEAQAAILLEEQARLFGSVQPMKQGYRLGEGGILDFRPLLTELADCRDPAYGAALFHATAAAGLSDWVMAAAEGSGIRVVGLGGGCFLNRILMRTLAASLAEQGISVLHAEQCSPGDSAVSLGQAWVALHALPAGEH